MNITPRFITKNAVVGTIIALIAMVGTGSVFAWTSPSANPPSGNVSAPINVGNTSQIKSGALEVNGFVNDGASVLTGNVGIGRSASYKLDVNGTANATQYCINGGSCITSWPSSGGGGTITGVTAGSGLSGGGSSGNVTLSSSDTLDSVVSRGNSTGNDIYAHAFFYSSDRSLKSAIQELNQQSALANILKLNGVSFVWIKDGSRDIGLVAQEVEQVYPELVGTNVDGTKAVKYGNLVAPLIQAVKAQQAEIEALKAEIRAIKANL